jgi:hypothetical protein
MNHTTLALVAVIAAAALVIGTLATTTAAFADSSKTVVKQSNKQKILQSGFVNLADQHASNCIAVLDGANACRGQETGQPTGIPGTPGT